MMAQYQDSYTKTGLAIKEVVWEIGQVRPPQILLHAMKMPRIIQRPRHDLVKLLVEAIANGNPSFVVIVTQNAPEIFRNLTVESDFSHGYRPTARFNSSKVMLAAGS